MSAVSACHITIALGHLRRGARRENSQPVVDTFPRLLIEIPFAIVTTAVAVRLLGVRRSWVATSLAGVLGWTAANVVQATAAGHDSSAARLSLSTMGMGLIFSMLIAVGLDFLARPGSLARGERAGLI